ncbi:hypothetical protein ACIA5C_31265 [Actinoplanes sp. NPDC051343]|uniref:hypothetical protein n=1 Tax=Actinoplanes sp. NPDC051343 TaxID=3363906 RepID=UPI0037A3880E
MRRRRLNITFGCFLAALAASILVIRVSNYAIFASIAIIVVLGVWMAILAKSS